MKEFYRPIEYKMPVKLAQELLKARKGNDAKKNKQAWLCEYVNTEYNLLGNCTRVILY